MLDFFKGWRRKLGVVTLVMACVFIVGWFRSRILSDRIDFNFRKHHQTVISLEGQLYWFRWRRESESRYRFGGALQTARFLTETDRRNNEAKWEHYADKSSPGKVGLRRVPKGHLFAEIIIPYWSTVIPLTLLSAILLLWPSRRAKPKP